MPGAGSAAAAAGAKKANTKRFLGSDPLSFGGSHGDARRESEGARRPVGAAKPPEARGDPTETQNMRFDAMEIEEEPEEVHTGLRWFVRSPPFNNFITFTILVGAVQMGAQADISDPGVQWLWDVFEHIFTVVFGVEMVLKVFALRGVYFRDPWNILDFVISWISIIGAWIIPFSIAVSPGGGKGDGDSSASLGVLRVFRLLRLFRILKIMKAVPELRMVIEGIAASLRAMFWVCMLLFIVIYMFSIYCVEILGRAEAGFVGYNQTVDSILGSKMMVNFNSFEYFGNIPRAMLSLFGVTLLAEYDVIRPVWECHQFSVVLFVLLIFLTSFGIVNVIIGVIVERTTSSMAEMERESELSRHENEQAKIIRLSEKVWAKTDSDGSGTISREELVECAGSADIVRLFKSLDWPKGWTLDDLHMMLDTDGGGELSQAEFCDGMHRLIFGNEFQRACMNMLTAGQIKLLSNEIKAITSQELVFLRQSVTEIKGSLTTVLAEVKGLGRGGGPMQEPNPTDPVKVPEAKLQEKVDMQAEIIQKDTLPAGLPHLSSSESPSSTPRYPSLRHGQGEHGAVVLVSLPALPAVTSDTICRNAIEATPGIWGPLSDEVDAAPGGEGREDGRTLSVACEPITSARAGSSWRLRIQADDPAQLRSAGAGDPAVQSLQHQYSRTWRCAANTPLAFCSADDSVTRAPMQGACPV